MSDELQRILTAKTLGSCVVDHVDSKTDEYRLFGAAAGSMLNSGRWLAVPPTTGTRGEVRFYETHFNDEAIHRTNEASGEIG